MKKVIQALLIIILTAVIALLIVVVFNPFELRTKFIGSIINGYLENTIEGYQPLPDQAATSSPDSSAETASTGTDKHPLLNSEQEQTLETYGVDVSQLPSTISPAMEACFVAKLGQERADEIVAGASPSAMEVFKARACLGE